MKIASRICVYIACSLDGFIAGPEGDLSWLPGGDPGTDTAEAPDPTGPPRPERDDPLEYEDFIASVGAILMGRTTYDAVSSFDFSWPYGDLPVLVATTKPLASHPRTVRAVSGDISTLIRAARTAAGGADVYLDGGNLIRQALDAELIDEMVVTFVPVTLGSGHALFAGTTKRHKLEFESAQPYGPGLLQVRVRPQRASRSESVDQHVT